MLGSTTPRVDAVTRPTLHAVATEVAERAAGPGHARAGRIRDISAAQRPAISSQQVLRDPQLPVAAAPVRACTARGTTPGSS